MTFGQANRHSGTLSVQDAAGKEKVSEKEPGNPLGNLLTNGPGFRHWLERAISASKTQPALFLKRTPGPQKRHTPYFLFGAPKSTQGKLQAMGIAKGRF
jgi:hypothetical protein